MMPSHDLRIVMLGTGDFAVPTFEHLLNDRASGGRPDHAA